MNNKTGGIYPQSFLNSLGELEKIIGYTFKDKDYLCNALTHSSFANECKAQKNQVSSNERLEFVGDKVLDLVLVKKLTEKFGFRAETHCVHVNVDRTLHSTSSDVEHSSPVLE